MGPAVPSSMCKGWCVLLVVVLAGCGGDDEPTQTTRELPELSIPSTEVAPAMQHESEKSPV